MRSTISHLLSPTLLPPPLNIRRKTPTFPLKNSRKFSSSSRTRTSEIQLKVSSSSSENQTVTFAPSPTRKDDDDVDDSDVLPSASDVVRSFYKGINDRDLGSVEELIAEKCVYEDLIFPRPFVGRKAILEFFKKFIDSFSKDLQFAIEDISAEDSLAVGVTWHLEWKGKAFPFSKGCSFYRLEVINGTRQIM
uniref:SnoaL-like domain-containing protein n=1 Tax=Manihot esculenta TaxID=3983 RepID=A0A2C9U3I0_MANES